MKQERSFIIKADSPAELRDELQAAAGYVHMFPAMFSKAEVDTQFDITAQCSANRVE